MEKNSLFNFKSRIEEFGYRVQQFVSYKFFFGKKQFTQKQFADLIRETDDTLQSTQLNTPNIHFVTQNQFQQHTRCSHPKAQQCQLCSNVYMHKQALFKHMKKHHSNKLQFNQN